MQIRFGASIFILALALLLGAPRAAHAAQSYDNCTGFITSLPTVITTQGTWCLKQDLATTITSGEAITIATNNVTLDCNDFKLGGLAAGTGTQTTGVYALDRINSTIRHCNIRGFYFGVKLEGNNSGGHAVEDNRFDGNTFTGIFVVGDGSVIRHNRLFDTGGSTLAASNFSGIHTDGWIDIEGNSVSGVVATTGSNLGTYGISTNNDSAGRIIGNGVRGLLQDGTGIDFAIFNSNSGRIVLRDNDVFGDGSVNSFGLRCTDALGHARDNQIANFAVGIGNCTDLSGNDIY